jgi:hypothetical protein
MNSISTTDTSNRTGGTLQFAAPWSRVLKTVSVAASALVIGITLFVSIVLPDKAGWVKWTVLPAGLLIVGISALFTVRGYEWDGRHLLVRRLFWNTRLSLAGLRDAYADPEAMRGSIRVCGNGGLFSFSGWFWSKRLGSYRALATDPRRAVVLVLPSKKIVVTPADPATFVQAVGSEAGTGGLGREQAAPRERAD